MTEKESERITAAARDAASRLPPMSDECARRIAAIIAVADAEAQEREAGSAA
jgi:hypothetical protein